MVAHTITLLLNASRHRYEIQPLDESDDIAAYNTADGGAKTEVVFDALEHGMANGCVCVITGSATTAYNGSHVVSNVNPSNKSFEIPVAYDNNPSDGSGAYDTNDFDKIFIQHLKNGGSGRWIHEGDKADGSLVELASLHNIALVFDDS